MQQFTTEPIGGISSVFSKCIPPQDSPQFLIKGIMSTSLDFRMGFYYSFDPNNGEFCRPFPLQAACTWWMIVMAPNNPRDDPELRGKLEGVWKAILGNRGFSLLQRAG
jgi:hypothetical protein